MSDDPLVGFATDTLRFERLLGKGGMGSVYLGHQLTMRRRVAIKVIAGHLMADERYRERFTREAQVLGRLVHPNIIACHDVGTISGPDGKPLWVMVLEYIEGWSLGALSRESRLTVRQVLELHAQVASGLAFAHRLGVVHRDIKPDNILISRAGVAKIADFGLARMEGSQPVTQTGSVIGTPAYMSPEACRGEVLTPASDLYSLGCTLYQILTDQQPYPLEGSLQILNCHLTAAAPDVRKERPDLARLQPILARCLAKRAADRWPDAQVLAEALRAEAVQHAEDAVAGRLRRSPVSGSLAAPTVHSGVLVAVPERYRRWGRWMVVAACLVFILAMAALVQIRSRTGAPSQAISRAFDRIEADLAAGRRQAAAGGLTTLQSLCPPTDMTLEERQRLERLQQLLREP